MAPVLRHKRQTFLVLGWITRSVIGRNNSHSGKEIRQRMEMVRNPSLILIINTKRCPLRVVGIRPSAYYALLCTIEMQNMLKHGMYVSIPSMENFTLFT